MLEEHQADTSRRLVFSLVLIVDTRFPAAVRDESSANMSQATSPDEIHNGRSLM